ncbi:MAG: DUF481 domain-containing protein [Planctomycetaceae bacterium]
MKCLAAILLLASLTWADALDQAVDSYLAAAEESDPGPWTIRGNLGVTLTSGNSDSFTVSAGADASRAWDPWTLFLKAGIVYGKSEGVESASEQTFTERLERAISEKASLFQEFYVEHDEREQLDYRLQFTVGYRRKLVEKENFVLHGEAGGGVLHEEFRTGPETEGIAQVGFDFVWKIGKNLTFTQRVVIFPSLSETGEFRILSESVFTTPLGERLDLRFAIIDKFDSNAPAGVKENDLLVTLSLQIRFTGKGG